MRSQSTLQRMKLTSLEVVFLFIPYCCISSVKLRISYACTGGWQTASGSLYFEGVPFYVENILEELDTPGEW